MKSHRIILSSLLFAAAFTVGAAAFGAEKNNEAPKPRFGDPSEHSASRLVSQPGGSPYYQPPSFQGRPQPSFSAAHPDGRNASAQ